MKKYKCPHCGEPAPNLLKHVAESCPATAHLRKPRQGHPLLKGAKK